jgi:hypothetical protein
MPFFSSHSPSSLDRWTVIAQQPRPVRDIDLVQNLTPAAPPVMIRYIGSRHGGAQLPGHDVAREVVGHGGQIEPAPAGDLEVGEVGLPKVVGRGRRNGLITSPAFLIKAVEAPIGTKSP